MKEIALEFINIIESANHSAYIVGGFVRDFLMGKTSMDIDITTSATPKEMKKIFSSITLPKLMNAEDSYGSIRVNYKNVIFEVTTFREESEYLDNRHPSRVNYVSDLLTDLKRRDFTVNAICMDKNGVIIDPLNGQEDLAKKIIRTIGDSKKSFYDDALRILRAVRFSSVLNFELDNNILEAIKLHKDLLKKISYERKKIELDKIFASPKAKEGIELIKKLDLVQDLELDHIDRVKDYTDLVGIWAMLNSPSYHFNKHEREMIKKVNIVYNYDNTNPLILYKYGLYVNILAGINKGISKKSITIAYNNLPIKSKSEIAITATDICKYLNKEPSSFLNEIFKCLEIEILTGNLQNTKKDILDYLDKNYKKINN